MTLTSFSFFLLLLFGVVVYYVIPKKVQWVWLLCLSLAYYYCAATFRSIIYILFSTAIAYASTNFMRYAAVADGKNKKKTVSVIAILAIVINIIIWFLLKGESIWLAGSGTVSRVFPAIPRLHSLHIAAALGMGYYTAQVIGYILDCYWGIIEPQENPLKLFLFVAFFSQLTVGPISKYSQLESLYSVHKFSYVNIAHGIQRILWGLFKKLVISDRIAIIVTGIWADTLQYNGIWLWGAVFLYPLQIYADFSGCVAICDSI